MLRKLCKTLAMVAGLTIALSVPGHAQEDAKTIRIGLQPAPLLGFVVKEKKLLEKRGFKPEWSVFPFSPPILEGMAAGSIDIALLGVGPVLSVAQRNPGIWYIYDELANAAGMIVQADSGIKGPEDLKGKKVAFPGKSSQLYAQLMLYLKDTGVSDTDMELIRVNAADMNTLFARKEVDAALAWPPFTTEPIRLGKAKSLFVADDLLKQKGGHWLNSGWGVRADFAKKHGDAVVAVVEALHEAARMLRENPEETYKIFSDATGYSLDAVRFMIENGYVAHYDPDMSAPSAENLIEIFHVLEKQRIVRDEGDVDETLQSLVHPEFVEKALANEKVE